MGKKYSELGPVGKAVDWLAGGDAFQAQYRETHDVEPGESVAQDWSQNSMSPEESKSVEDLKDSNKDESLWERATDALTGRGYQEDMAERGIPTATPMPVLPVAGASGAVQKVIRWGARKYAKEKIEDVIEDRFDGDKAQGAAGPVRTNTGGGAATVTKMEPFQLFSPSTFFTGATASGAAQGGRLEQRTSEHMGFH